MHKNSRELLGLRVTRSWRVGGDFASKAAQTYIILLIRIALILKNHREYKKITI